jgi:uncharacterized integral membrane protein
MKKPIIMILSAVMLILTIIFTLQNAEDVLITYFFWDGTSSLSLLLFMTLAIGIISAVMLLVPLIAHLNRTIEEAKKQSVDQKKNKSGLPK